MSNQLLMRALADFQERQKELSSSSDNDRALKLADLFEPIAKQLLYGGCFEVYSKGALVREVFPHTVEFYYHEEAAGGFKDYIVYHRSKVTIIDGKEIKDVPYFELGAINAHQSGIDFTFESKEKQYRASVFIRAFKYLSGSKEIIDKRSTYLYDHLFTGLEMPITIQWKGFEFLSDIKPKQGLRMNSFLLKPNPGGEGKPIKDQDNRPWAFSVEEFPKKLQYKPEPTTIR